MKSIFCNLLFFLLTANAFAASSTLLDCQIRPSDFLSGGKIGVSKNSNRLIAEVSIPEITDTTTENVKSREILGSDLLKAKTDDALLIQTAEQLKVSLKDVASLQLYVIEGGDDGALATVLSLKGSQGQVLGSGGMIGWGLSFTCR